MLEFFQTTIEWLKTVAPWLAVGSVAIEIIPPIKLKPWTWFARTIGKAINHDMLAEIKELRGEVESIKKKNEKQDDERQLDRALSARRRILQFAEEIRRGVKHSL